MTKGILASALLATFGTAGAAQAAMVTFEVDPARSILSLGQMGVGGETGYEQEGGASRSYSGTLEADIVGNTIHFPGGFPTIIADNSAAPLLPGSTPANYAIWTVDNGFTAALRNFQFAFEKDGAPYNIAADGTLLDPDRGNEPYTPRLTGSWTIDTQLFGGLASTDEEDVLNNFASPPRTAAATLRDENGVLTLEIPVVTHITWSELGAGDSQFQLLGTIVATSGIIPEPGALSVLVLGSTLLVARRRRV